MATRWGALLITSVIGLIMVPFLLKQLGTEGYGLIGLLGVIVSFSIVADLGLRQALGRELAEQVARKDPQAFSELASSALVLYLLIAGVLATCGWILAPWFVEVFKVSPPLRETAVKVIRVYGTLSVIFSFISPVFTAGLSSHHRFDLINGVQMVGGILSSLLLFAVIPRSGNALYGWVGVMLSYQIVNFILFYVLFRRFCPGAHIGVRLIRPRRLRPLFQLGGYMYVLQLTNALSERLDPLVISFYMGPPGVALYRAGARINEIVRPAVLSLAEQVTPLTTQYHVRKQESQQHRLLIDGTRYTLYLGAVCSIAIMLFAEIFSRLWLFDSLGESCQVVARVMQLWALANLVNYSGAMHWPLCLGMKKLPFALALQVPSSIINAALSIYFVGYTQAGIPGVLYATVLTEIIRRPFAIWYVARITRLNLLEYLKRGYALAIGYILLLLIPGYLVLNRFTISGWIQFILSAGLFLVYALLVLCVIERKLVVILYRQVRSRMT